jgi:outer membrane protein OmpU
MKKVLFATTALIATAGVASAQGVSLSGSAEMGLIGGDGMTTQFHTDIDVRFTLSGTTDNGLTFGASIDLDEEGGFSNTNGGPEAVFLSGNFGTITMGDTDGAFDWALAEVPTGSGSIADDESSHGGWNGNSLGDGTYDGQILRYDHSVGGFGIAVSAELDDSGVGDTVFGIGLTYSMDLGGVDLGIGLGYQDYATDQGVGISLRAGLGNGLTVGLNYSDLGDTDAGGIGETHLGLGVSYSMDAITFGVNWGQYEEGANDQSGWGLSAGYDLGGGASIVAGYGSTTDCGVYAGCAVGDSWSLGVSMSF